MEIWKYENERGTKSWRAFNTTARLVSRSVTRQTGIWHTHTHTYDYNIIIIPDERQRAPLFSLSPVTTRDTIWFGVHTCWLVWRLSSEESGVFMAAHPNEKENIPTGVEISKVPQLLDSTTAEKRSLQRVALERLAANRTSFKTWDKKHR